MVSTYDVNQTRNIDLKLLDSMKVGHFLVGNHKCFYREILIVIHWRGQIIYISLTTVTGLVYKDINY